jgi:hypothetical protein
MGALDAAEADRIDAYVPWRTVRKAERRKFENRFLTSPQRRRKVEFARIWPGRGRSPSAEGASLKSISLAFAAERAREWNPALQFGLDLLPSSRSLEPPGLWSRTGRSGRR